MTNAEASRDQTVLIGRIEVEGFDLALAATAFAGISEHELSSKCQEGYDEFLQRITRPGENRDLAYIATRVYLPGNSAGTLAEGLDVIIRDTSEKLEAVPLVRRLSFDARSLRYGVKAARRLRSRL